jgi:hypothetical protein
MEPMSFDNRLNGGTIAIPIGAAAPAGVSVPNPPVNPVRSGLWGKGPCPRSFG